MTLQTSIRPALAALLALGLAACTAAPDEDATAGVVQNDPAITASIQSQYFTDATVKGLMIDVDTEDGRVVLAGTVESEAARQRAIAIAEGTEGVTSVEDRLRVRAADMGDMAMAEEPGVTRDPEDQNDDFDAGWITTKIEAQYFLDPDVKGRNIDVITATDGRVTLHGEVDSASARQQAISIARGTEGVTGVDDQLRIVADGETAAVDARGTMDDTGEAMSDSWITTKIQARYFLDPDVKGRDINVTTVAGVVTLAGTVESDAERRQAAAMARETDGVVQVNDSLQVVPDADEPDDVDANIDDAWVTTKIQAQYFVDPDVSSFDIDVTTREGVVTLEGEVETSVEKMLAESIARQTDGVDEVVNRLVVNADGR